MKRFLVFLCFVIVGCAGAQASQTVYYMNTGVPAYVQYGAGPKISYRRAMAMERASAARHYPPRHHRINPHARRPYGAIPYGYYYGPRVISQPEVHKSKPAVAQISRFDRNYHPSRPKSYVKNGITYYN